LTEIIKKYLLSLSKPKEVKALELRNTTFEILKYIAENPSTSYDCYKHMKKHNKYRLKNKIIAYKKVHFKVLS